LFVELGGTTRWTGGLDCPLNQKFKAMIAFTADIFEDRHNRILLD
jgi:hypothetical protein